jgi:hypothetical protein
MCWDQDEYSAWLCPLPPRQDPADDTLAHSKSFTRKDLRSTPPPESPRAFTQFKCYTPPHRSGNTLPQEYLLQELQPKPGEWVSMLARPGLPIEKKL